MANLNNTQNSIAVLEKRSHSRVNWRQHFFLSSVIICRANYYFIECNNGHGECNNGPLRMQYNENKKYGRRREKS